MKILYLSTPSFADCDFPLIKEFIRQGHDITYLITLTPYSLKSTLFNIEKQLPCNDIIPASKYKELYIYSEYMNLDKVFIVNRTSPKDSSLNNLKLTLKLYTFIKKGKFDIIHTDCFLKFYDTLLYRYKNKLVQTFHDPFPHSGERSMKSDLFRHLAAKLSKRIILLNEKQKKQFAKLYKININHIDINKLGIYDCIRTFKIQQSSPRNSHNILFFGRISPYKGIEFLTEAMIKVHEVIPDATLTIAGGGKLYFNFQKYSNLKYINLINRYVDMEELAHLLQKSEIVACPYTDATQSGVIMTSYSLCKPVVATNVGGLEEMVDSEKSGILVSPKDSDALANAIIHLLKDEELKKQMQDYIKEQYFHREKSWQNIVAKYICIYQNTQK